MTMTRTGGWILLVCLAAPAAAQDVGRFDDLARLIEAGDDVRVTVSGGRDVKAQVVGVTPIELSVLARGARLDLGEADVWAVHRRVDDPTRNGAIIGFAAGAGCALSSLVPVFTSGDMDLTGAELVGVAALNVSLSGMLGWWVGAGVDALIETEEEVYRRGRRRTRLTVAPLLSSGRHGATVSLGF